MEEGETLLGLNNMGGKQTKEQKHNYYLRNRESILSKQKINHCLDCNKFVDKRAKRCRKCARICLRKFKRDYEIGQPIKKCLCGCGRDIIFQRYMRNDNFSNYILGHRPSPRKGKGKIYNPKNCSFCKKELTRLQLRRRCSCCSKECSHKSLSKNGKKNRTKQIFPLRDTKPELKIQNFLKDLNIQFEKHKYIPIENAYQCDLFIPSLNLIIECDGDYWHGNLEVYPIRRLTNKIKRQRCLDFERNYQLEEQGYRIIRLWENEIRNMSIENFKTTLLNNKISLQEVLL